MKKRLSKLGVIIMLSVMSTTSLHANSSNEPACEEVLNSCDEALRAADEALSAQDDQIDALLEAQKASQERIEQLERSNESIFRSPLVVGLVGVIGGLVLGAVVAR